MTVLDENMTFIWIFIENLIFFLNFYFVLGIILDHFRHPKSIFRYRKLKILWKFAKHVFDLKIDFLWTKSVSRLKKTEKSGKKTGKTWKIKTDVTEPWVTSKTTVSSVYSEAWFMGSTGEACWGSCSAVAKEPKTSPGPMDGTVEGIS